MNSSESVEAHPHPGKETSARPGIAHLLHSFQRALTAQRLKRGALLCWAVLFMLITAVIDIIGLVKQPPHSGRLIALLLIFMFAQTIATVVVLVVPARRLLFAGGVIQIAALLLWSIAHNLGLSDGFTTWHPETLGVPDLYAPVLDGLSAFFLFCLAANTWTVKRRVGRVALAAFPVIVLVALLVWAVMTNPRITEIVTVIIILDSNPPTGLFYLFFPAIGLLALLLVLRLILPELRARTKGAWRTSLILLPALLVTSMLLWGGGVSAANTAWFSDATSTSVHAPAPGQTTTLHYCTFGSPLAMDISEPSAQAARPAPVVFYIHGGETLQGSRTLEDGSVDGAHFAELRTELLNSGFVVGSIDYSLAPFSNIPNEVKEAKCAVRFLRAYASELGIDPRRIGVYGPSQGGYISAMLGTVGSRSGYDVGQYLKESSHVEAVVDMWGPTDLGNFSGSPSWVSALSGGSSKALLRTVSPVTFAATGDPPFLIMHGTDDWFIAPHHSQQLAQILHADAVPVTLVMIQHDGHGLDAPSAGQVQQPSPETLIHMIRDFFARTLAA